MSEEKKLDAPAQADDGGFWAFEYEKCKPETLLMIGRSMAYGHAADLLEIIANKTLDIVERKVLEKVVNTLQHHKGLSSVKAVELARASGGVKRKILAPGSDTQQ